MGGACVVTVAGLGLAWLLAHPDGPESTAIPANVAVGAAVLLVGLGGLPQLGAVPSSRLVGVVGAIWAVAALTTAWVRAADQAGVGVLRLDVGRFADSAHAGAPDLVAAGCAVLVVGWAVADLITETRIPVAAVAILAGVGLLATSISGHPGQTTWGPVLVGLHALAAAWWCGTLLALAVAVRGRSGWARALPVFSSRAQWAVGVIALTGVIAGIIEIGVGWVLVDTGYGRLLIAKSVGLVILVGIAAWHRSRWLPEVRRHRGSESTAIRRAAVEIAVMAVVIGLAVGLSATAP
nr:CopD family protein [Gordonia soli]